MDYTGFIKNRPVYLVAQEVDVNFGNNDGKIEGKERSIFTNIIKARFGFDFNFNGDINAQGDALDKIYHSEKIDNLEGEKFFASINYIESLGRFEDGIYTGDYACSIDIIGNNAGYASGVQFAEDATEFTDGKESRRMSRTLDKLSMDFGSKLNSSIITNFLQGYYAGKGWTDSGILEQLASEADSSKITNKQITGLLQAIMNGVPEDKRKGKDWDKLVGAHEKYAQKDPQDLFKDEQPYITRLWPTTNYIDNIDDAIERLYNL